MSDEVNAKNVRKGKGNQIEMIQAKQGNLRGNEEGAADVYYNAGPMTKQRSTSAIRISDFGAYFKSGLSSKDFFFAEFQVIYTFKYKDETKIRKEEDINHFKI